MRTSLAAGFILALTAVAQLTLLGTLGSRADSPVGWSWLSPQPAGSDLHAAACLPDGRCLAVGEGGAVTRVEADGRTAHPTSAADGRLEAIGCGDARCVVVGQVGATAITDDGIAWRPVPSASSLTLRAVSCAAAHCAAVGEKGTTSFSDDGGASWTAGTAAPTSRLTALSCSGPSSCVAGDRQGATWISADGGRSWSRSAAPVASAITGISCSDSRCLAVSDSGTALRSTDGGASWVSAETGLASARALTCRGAVCLAGGADGSLASTPDRGASWSRRRGLGSAIEGVACSPTQCLVAGVGGRVARSTDGGLTWSELSTGPVDDLAGVSCADSTHCVAVGGFGAPGHLATSDGGRTWQRTPAAAPLRAVSCPAPSSCVAVGDLGSVDITGDGGLTWASPPSGLPTNLLGVSCPTPARCLAVGNGATAIISQDGGQSWTAMAVPGTERLTAIDCPTPVDCVAVGGRTLLRTADGGASWRTSDAGLNGALLSVACSSASLCSAAADDGTLVVITPSAASPRMVDLRAAYLGVTCTHTRLCYAVGEATSGGVPSPVEMSLDGGITWAHQSPRVTLSLHGVSCTGAGRCTAVGAGGAILGTGDGTPAPTPRPTPTPVPTATPTPTPTPDPTATPSPTPTPLPTPPPLPGPSAEHKIGVRGTDDALWVLDPTGSHGFGGILSAAPAVVALPQSSGRNALFIADGSDHQLWQRTAGSPWTALGPPGTQCLDAPGATVRGAGTASAELVVSCLGTDASIWWSHAPLQGSGVQPVLPPFAPLGGRSRFGVAVSLTPAGSPVFAATGTDSVLWWRTEGRTWTSLAGTVCAGHPALAATTAGVAISCHGGDGALWTAVGDGARASAFSTAQGALIDGPGLAVVGDLLVATVQGTDGRIWQRRLDPASGRPTDAAWTDRGGQVRGGTAAAAV